MVCEFGHSLAKEDLRHRIPLAPLTAEIWLTGRDPAMEAIKADLRSESPEK
jgi:hypothetical protein